MHVCIPAVPVLREFSISVHEKHKKLIFIAEKKLLLLKEKKIYLKKYYFYEFILIIK
jgi:hypothetical protein